MIKLMLKYYIIRIYTAIHSMWLCAIREDGFFINEEKYQHIRRCAALAYPGEELDYNNCLTLSEWMKKTCCGKGEIYVMNGQDWYLIVTRKFGRIYIDDFASSTKRCFEIPKVFTTLMMLFPNRKVYSTCRESTSYQLIRFYARHGAYTILQDDTIEMDGENYHKMILIAKQ